MLDQPESRLGDVVGNAFRGGVEVSIEEVATLLNVLGTGQLEAVQRVAEFFRPLGLEFSPGVSQGGLADARVLRGRIDSGDVVERVRRILDLGEGPTVEYKSSLFASMHHWTKDGTVLELAALQGEVLKTICAFLNTDGGDLLIGIDDNGRCCGGVQRDIELIKGTVDKWQLRFTDLVVGRFHGGPSVLPYIRTRMVDLDGEWVFHVAVVARRTRTFVQREKNKPFEFFVRNGSRTDSLDLVAFQEHLVANSIIS